MLVLISAISTDGNLVLVLILRPSLSFIFVSTLVIILYMVRCFTFKGIFFLFKLVLLSRSVSAHKLSLYCCEILTGATSDQKTHRILIYAQLFYSRFKLMQIMATFILVTGVKVVRTHRVNQN